MNLTKYIAKKLTKNMALTWNLGRAAHFATQQRLLPLVETLTTGKKPWAPKNLAAKRRELLAAAYELLARDAENFSRGIYPLRLLQPENSWRHALRFAHILTDATRISKRREARQHKDFSPTAQAQVKNSRSHFPAYYLRNFHFQTDGYLSPDSAELYDHQVDLLFLGTTDAMRRALVAALKHHLPHPKNLLEIGCGTGRLTNFAAAAWPHTKITALDPSEAYLAKAKDRNAGAKIKFVTGFGEQKIFKPASFAGVYSSFLFHELPTKVRLELMREAMRVTAPGGYIALLDSLQRGDQPQFDWALERFPVDFHEPFYKAYTQDPMEKWPNKIKGLELVDRSFHFLGKVCIFRVNRAKS